MKYIKKGGSPHKYRLWCKAVKGTQKERYKEIPKDEKRVLLGALLTEQGALCAYTMKRINPDLAHVEHIKPQSAFPEPKNGADLAFDNLVACFPRDGMNAAYRYGAQRKDEWWEEDGEHFVSPLDRSCERRFRFSLDGSVSPVDTDAKTTIAVLGLDHPTLCEDRSRALYEFIYGRSGDDPLSVASARQGFDEVCRRDPGGNFREYCVAIRHSLADHLNYLERLAKKTKAIRRSR